MSENRPPRAGSRPPTAFTLIELLIVVAIIAILAAIAVPNFLEAQMRSKVSRTKSDMRSLKTAVESYHVDHNEYPFRRSLNSVAKPDVPHTRDRLPQMRVLTTPVAYITSLPVDSFERRIPAPNNLIDYWDSVQASWFVNRFNPSPGDPQRVSPDEIGYLLVSVGPDGYLHPLQPMLYGWPHPHDPGLTLLGNVRRVYDPTNGTVSIGNIWDGSDGQDGAAQRLLQAFAP